MQDEVSRREVAEALIGMESALAVIDKFALDRAGIHLSHAIEITKETLNIRWCVIHCDPVLSVTT